MDLSALFVAVVVVVVVVVDVVVVVVVVVVAAAAVVVAAAAVKEPGYCLKAEFGDVVGSLSSYIFLNWQLSS